jgi:hypothetical protein
LLIEVVKRNLAKRPDFMRVAGVLTIPHYLKKETTTPKDM